MALQQTQLMLIVDNIGLPAPSKATVYDEVMDIWIKAMIMADRLIGGMAQSVQNADDLLGLCAWHIYPDIHAIGTKATTIEQKDSLVNNGGLLTIGLRNAGDAGPTGVSWSMPLAHLRFYGKPVVSLASIGSTSSRVPFDRGMNVVLGALTSEWPSSHVDLAKLARFLVLFADALRAGVRSILEDEKPMPESLHQELSNLRRLTEKHPTFSNFESTAYWPSLLSLQAQTYLHSNEIEQREIARFFALGRRRYGNTLGNTQEHPSPHFGLSHTGLYIQLTTPDRRVSKLREMARMFDDQQALNGAIIRVTHPKDSMGYQMTEFATLFPQNVEGTSSKAHRRWIIFPDPDDRDLGQSSGPFTEPQLNAVKRSIAIMRYHREPCGLLASNSLAITSSKDLHGWQESIHDASIPSPCYQLEFTWLNQSAPVPTSYLMEQTVWADHILPAKQKAQGWRIGHSEHAYDIKKYYYLYGDSSRAAVFQSAHELVSRRPDYALPADYIIRAIENGDLDSLRFVNHFVPRFHPHLVDLNISAYFQSLISSAYADKIFTNLPQAEINLNVFAKTLCESKWAKALLTENDQEFGTAVSLACVSLFDTGYIDLQVEDLKDVLAISSANSIYASALLFCDPGHRPPGHHLRHVIGNVGKPGLALLLSSRDTILREPDLETWQLVNHARFDGCFDDNFSSTTLHLSLTGYEQRLNTSRYGCRDKEAFYLETVVSAYDKGTWAADLDLLHLVHGPFLRIDASCGHDSHTGSDSSIFPGLTSIDNWHEYLDRPPNTAVIRASGNWVARLAFAAIPLPNKEALVVASETICWRCLMDKLLEKGSSVLEERLILC